MLGAVEHFAKCGFPCPPKTNPSDFFLDTMTIDYRSDELKEKSLARVQTLQDAWIQKPVPAPVATSAPLKEGMKKYWNNSAAYEIMVLLRRNFNDVLRDKATIGSTIGQSVINTLILGFVFFRMNLEYEGVQNRIGALFFMCIQLTFGNVSFCMV